MSAVISGTPIVLVFLDQLRADALGAAGNRFVRTPNLDRFASQSVRFATAVTNAPLCRPARVSLMTGLPVHLHRVSTNARLPRGEEMESHVRRLRDEAGYHTMVIGKTHLHTGHGHFDAHRDRLYGWGFADALELPDPQQHWVRSAHADWLSATTLPGEVDKFLRWMDYIVDYTWDSPPPDAAPWSLSQDDHLDSFCARTAADYVRSYAGDEPLYLAVNFPGPHPPFDAPSSFDSALDPDDPALPMPILAPSIGPVSPAADSYARHQKIEPADWTDARARALRVRYYAKVGLVDHCVGQVFEALREAGIYDSAWIIVTADHGELAGDHGMTGKVLAYDGSIRVPLLIRPPGGTSGWVDEGTVDLLDVTATITELGGLEPTERGGQSLVRRVSEGARGRLAHHHKAVLFENMGYAGLRSGDQTLGWHLAFGQPVELFDRRTDPDELHNRVEEPDHKSLLDELVEELRRQRPLPLDRYTR